jgi:RimJ/RimL family protein N-acetyltransferase
MMVSSPRLRYEPLGPDHLDDFHALVQDEHIRRYLMDGELMTREWSDARVRDSQMLAARRGVGLSLVFERTTAQLVGFCGFLVIPSISPEPQLVYALQERFTGLGYATEMARAAIDDARAAGGFDEIIAGVDAVNAASSRVLEKLSFERTATLQGAFGDVFTYRLRL